ncbi:MAG: ATP-binding protein [Pyrinomonadaceae bacterium]
MRSVHAKLLAMLAVLSLPLLVVSLVQLSNYRENLTAQAGAIAAIEASSSAASLKNWLEDNPTSATKSVPLNTFATRDLYERIRNKHFDETESLLVVLDNENRSVPNELASLPAPSAVSVTSSDVQQQRWTDGIRRITSIERVAPYGWSVAVGVPLPEDTRAGRGILWLTSTWALTLACSILLAIWSVGRFTNPLRRLASSAGKLGGGRLQERVVVETRDEVGTLAENFNLMAESLQVKFNELQTQGAFIEEVLDSLPLGVVVLDTKLTVRKANPTFAKFAGRDSEALENRGIYEAAAGLAALSDIVEDVRRTRRPFVTYGLQLNLVARSKEKEQDPTFWDVILWPTTRQTSERGDLILILSEVSKRVHAEKLATTAFSAERSRTAELESVINQMNEGVVIVDSRGRYRINLAASRILARAPGEFRDGVDALIDDIALRDTEGRLIPTEATPLRRALDKGEIASGEQYKIKTANGEERVLAISVTPLVVENAEKDSKRSGIVAVFRDITVEVRQHNEVVSAYERLREHDRLKSAFVANISHELRTPLNVILGICQLLGRDRQLPLAPLQTEAVGRMERNARSLLLLVNDLLDYSRLEAGRSALHIERVNVAELIDEVAETHAQEAREKSIELRAETEDDLQNLTTDKNKLTQVISILVSNALKFTPPGGSINVVASLLDAERWQLEVKDNGIGMSADEVAIIFDEFRQADDRLTRQYGGVGLGLAITRKIVELLDGEITVESEPERGSRFRIVFPRAVRPRTGTGSLVRAKENFTTPNLRVRVG